MNIFFQKNNKNDGDLFSRLKTACEGLVYISETDAPLLAFSGPATDAVTADTILQQAGLPAETPVEERQFAEFFARLTAINDWYDDERKACAKRFLDLQKLLEENLRELKVFKVGRIQLDIFVVGIDKDGCLTGVTTRAVET
jgi:Nuclease A inhibitor-like protein